MIRFSAACVSRACLIRLSGDCSGTQLSPMARCSASVELAYGRRLALEKVGPGTESLLNGVRPCLEGSAANVCDLARNPRALLPQGIPIRTSHVAHAVGVDAQANLRRACPAGAARVRKTMRPWPWRTQTAEGRCVPTLYPARPSCLPGARLQSDFAERLRVREQRQTGRPCEPTRRR